MSEARALTNFAGNAVATVLVGQSGPGSSTGPGRARCSPVALPFDEATMLDDDEDHGEPVTAAGPVAVPVQQPVPA